MVCRCGSANQKEFGAEVAIHFRGLENIDKPIVWVFPKLWVCLDCGNARFAITETELNVLAKEDAPAGQLRAMRQDSVSRLD